MGDVPVIPGGPANNSTNNSNNSNCRNCWNSGNELFELFDLSTGNYLQRSKEMQVSGSRGRSKNKVKLFCKQNKDNQTNKQTNKRLVVQSVKQTNKDKAFQGWGALARLPQILG